MRYIFLICEDEAQYEQTPPDQFQALIAEYQAFTEAAQEAGVFVSGDALQPTSTATSVRVRDGASLTSDGPFAETKEQLGGFYILDCPDLDEALQWAARIPGAKTGTIEVRPIMVFGS